MPNNKILEDTPMDDELLELVPGKTVIGHEKGKINGVYQDLTILYGNAISPVTNIDNPLHYKEEAYMEMLKNFLNSEEGMKYRVPTKEEVDQATIEVLNMEERIRQKMKEEAKAKEAEEKRIQEEKEKAEQARLAEEERIAKEKAEAERLEQERIENERIEQERLEAQKQEELRLQEEAMRLEEEQRAKEEEEELLRKQEEERLLEEKLAIEQKERQAKENKMSRDDKTIRKLKWFLIASMVLLIASMIGNAWLFLNRNQSSNLSYGQLSINGEVYEIPLANVDVKDGESRIIIYGISSTNTDGKISNSVLPLGEFKLEGSKLVDITNAKGDQLEAK